MQGLIGLQSLLKEGSRHYSGLEEAMLKNIDAVVQLSDMTKSSLGPSGMNKIVVTHLDKVIVTSDAATIVEEVEVHHPAARMLSQAAKMQAQEVGDGTNFVIVLCGELLKQAEELIKMGLHPSFIRLGYEKAFKKALTILESLVCYRVQDLKKESEVLPVIRSVLCSKVYGYEDYLSPIVYNACVQTLDSDSKIFDSDNVRVAKISGSSFQDSFLIKGLVALRGSDTSIIEIKNAKVAIYNCPIEANQGDTKGTVLLKTAEELMNYTKSEEETMDKFIKSIADTGVNVVICGGTCSDNALHFFEKYKIMIIKVLSKFEIKRFSKALGAPLLAKHGPPTPEEIGEADEISVQEISSKKVTIFKRAKAECKISTIVLRGATQNLLDDAERAIEDAVNVFKCMTREERFLPGCGTTELLMASEIINYSKSESGLEQYAIRKFGESFEEIPRIIVTNAGLKADEIIANLYAETSKDKNVGIDLDSGKIKPLSVYDSLEVKTWGIKLAADTAITILNIDQLIMSKPAGGPKPKEGPKDPD